MIDKEAIKTALEALGKTADEVAASLQAKGIKGVQQVCSACPLAQYLQSLWYQVRVGVNIVWSCSAYGDEIADDDEIVDDDEIADDDKMTLTPATEAFRIRFDHGEYPFLRSRELKYP